MKFLKYYEGNRYIKHSDPLALYNKLRTFSEKLEKILLLLKKLNNDDREKVKRYFKDENNISIYYFVSGTKILKISLTHNKDNSVTMTIIFFKNYWCININFFINFINETLSDYKFSEKDKKKYNTTKFKFHYLESNRILELIKNYEIYINSIKYNL